MPLRTRPPGVPEGDLRPGPRSDRARPARARADRNPRVPATLGNPSNRVRPPRLPRREPHAAGAFARDVLGRLAVRGPPRARPCGDPGGHDRRAPARPRARPVLPHARRPDARGVGTFARDRLPRNDRGRPRGNGANSSNSPEVRPRPPRGRETGRPSSPRRPPWLGGILHGAIDADRIDYLQRDAHYTGVAHGAIDAVRLLDTLRVSGGASFSLRRDGAQSKGSSSDGP